MNIKLINEEENKKYIIYCYTNQINNKKYIGQTCQTAKRRARGKGCGYKNYSLLDDDVNQPLFWKAIKKYRWENFIYEILEQNLSIEEANEREKYWISYYHTWINDPECNGYNLDIGGGNGVRSQDTKDKLKKANGRPVYCVETDTVYISAREAERIITGKDKSNNHPIITDVCNGIGLTGHKMHWCWNDDLERKEILINQFKTNNFPKRSAVNARPVICLEENLIFPSCNEAGRWTGDEKHSANINACCHGKQKTSYGYHWRFVEENEN